MSAEVQSGNTKYRLVNLLKMRLLEAKYFVLNSQNCCSLMCILAKRNTGDDHFSVLKEPVDCGQIPLAFCVLPVL